MRRRYDLADANHDPDGSEIHARDESRLPREHGRRVPPERNFDPYEDVVGGPSLELTLARLGAGRRDPWAGAA